MDTVTSKQSELLHASSLEFIGLQISRSVVPWQVRCRHQAFVPVNINGDSHVVWKVGAFQAFVKDAEMSEDFGHTVHAVQDVHRIGILDIRTLNFDRNLSNMTLDLTVNCPEGRVAPIKHSSSRSHKIAAGLLPPSVHVCFHSHSHHC